MTIRSDRLYLIEVIPGISGFQRWNERERYIVTGHKARLMRSSVRGEFVPSAGRYRLCDGHLPEFQPVIGPDEASDYLAENPYSMIAIAD